jgi:5-methylcytosine-specific restriction protein A
MVKLAKLTQRVAPLTTTRVRTIESSSKRITGRMLQARNTRYLREHPLCARCEAEGRTAAAMEVDHKIPLHVGGQDVESNLQGLCIKCHEAKSAREAHERSKGLVLG